jgi:hypothetical protein
MTGEACRDDFEPRCCFGVIRQRARVGTQWATRLAPEATGAWRDPFLVPGELLDVHPGDQSFAEGVDVDDASLRQHSSV